MNREEILSHVDHTLLKPEATWPQIQTLCDEAIANHTASVCINTCYVKQAVEYMAGRIPVCCVVGFPLGAMDTASKAFEAKTAIENGAAEVDMVINIGRLKNGEYDAVREDIRAVKQAVGDKVLKVIIETCLLTEAEKIRLCEIVSQSGADYIKTSTGFAGGGATRADVALLVIAGEPSQEDLQWAQQLKEQNTPFLVVQTKGDLAAPAQLPADLAERAVAVSAATGDGIEALRAALTALVPEDFGRQDLTRGLCSAGDVVLLVMPQDIQAPKGRLILPQVRTIRHLLDLKCTVVSTTADGLDGALAALSAPPKLIITDSQCFPLVAAKKPEKSLLTSFSILMAADKGDIDAFAQGAKAIGTLNQDSRVLIAEGCTHAPLEEDIGRVKIPNLLRKRVGQGLQVDVVAGNDFPHDLTGYDLVIHCGGCMFNRAYVLSRLTQAQRQGVPMTNYGVAIAYLTGILEQVSW